MTLNRLRMAALLALIALVAGGLVWSITQRPKTTPSELADAIGGPFTLVDQNGRAVTETVLRGHWNAVFFGYTYCPDICPGTLQAMTAAKQALGSRGKAFRIVFISVDPERDTPAVVKAWLDANQAPAGTLALTGTRAQTDAAIRAYRVFYEKAGSGSNYLVNHSTVVYLMDPKGRFSRPLPFNLPDEAAKQALQAIDGH